MFFNRDFIEFFLTNVLLACFVAYFNTFIFYFSIKNSIKIVNMFQKFSVTDILFVLMALASIIFSLIAYFKGDKEMANFVGHWVPSILGFGIFLKLIKMNKNG
jgi:hypothetical protein